MKTFCLFFVGLLVWMGSIPALQGQGVFSDSLRNVLDATKGEERVQLLLDLGRQYKDVYPLEAALLYERAFQEAQATQNDLLKAKVSMSLGLLNRNQGNYQEGMTRFLDALHYAERSGEKQLQADAAHKLASSHLWLFEYNEAYVYAQKEIPIWRELGDKKGLAAGLNLSGLVLANLGQYDSAFLQLHEAQSIAQAIQHEDLLYKTTLNIGDTYLKKGDYAQALEWMERSLEITQRNGDYFGKSIVQLKIGQAHTAKKDFVQAIGYLEDGLALAQDIKATSVVRNGYKYLMEAYKEKGDFERAFQFLDKYQALKDSLLTAESRRTVEQLKAQYHIQEKESENQILREQNKIQNYQSYLMATFTILSVLLGLIIWKRYQEKIAANDALQEQNREIQEKNAKIGLQSRLIEEKNNAIRSSVVYAKRIQSAVQINETNIFERYTEYFIFYRPRDIVSGDVYWFFQTEDYYLVAAADCTGHGIPGALMTILCNSLLSDIVRDRVELSPQDILYELDSRLKAILHQRVSHINDGMEIALCKIFPDQNQITYVGAKMPLIHYNSAGKQRIFKPSIFPIGGHDFKSEKTFTEETFSFQKGDMIYLASDGYQDQFGGSSNRKFLRKRFRQLLDTCQSLTAEEQQILLEQTFDEWRGDTEQTDDVLVMGIRF
ncbi:MAG: SpoIIE family protein phosphatase [Bernardetiaceae bacterium]